MPDLVCMASHGMTAPHTDVVESHRKAGDSLILTVTQSGSISSVVEAPRSRRGIAELDGKGETVGGIVVMRHGENALAIIERIEARLKELAGSLPERMRVVDASGDVGGSITVAILAANGY